MRTISDLLSRDLTRKIEEIIKVNQTDESSVYTEITEYIATDRIKDQYREVLKAFAEAPKDPHEGVGVWVSGFFGSGKSSFAKNLGYILSNPNVLGENASDLFKKQVDDRRIADLMTFINTAIPTKAIMFDINVDKALTHSTQSIAEIIYTALLRELNYAIDFDIAELEIELEREGKLEDFEKICHEMYQLDWRMVRKGAQKYSRTSAILHALDPKTYPTAEAWAKSHRDRKTDITVGEFVERSFELCTRRCPGKALIFIIDEVGQYVARSEDKIENLRAVVEQFGRVGKNLLKAKKITAPTWLVVTSQEKLDEVVAALDSKRIELAKLQDRFKYRIDMSPADIREVATRRVLAKTGAAVSVLESLYEKSQGQLNAALRWERTSRDTEIKKDDFVQFYPYPPHFIELSIDIMSGIRLQPGAPKQLGGSNRTIIKQAYEMIVSDRTRIADQPVGTLVTLDKIFELVEGNLSSEKQKDISDIRERFKNDPEDRGMALRVAKAVALLEFVKDLPRTDVNIAACLVDAVGKPAPIEAVKTALEKLYKAQFIRNTPDGWKLQTAQEKNWETERRSYLHPKPKYRHEILNQSLEEIFSQPKLKIYRYQDLRNFRVGITVDGNRVGEEGQIPLSIITCDDSNAHQKKLQEIRSESRHQDHQNEIYWVFSLNKEIDDLVANLYASREMVRKYDQLKAQNKITSEEMACLHDEKSEISRFQKRLEEKLTQAIEEGVGVFRGVAKDAATLGNAVAEMFKNLFDHAVPNLYPKLPLAARPLKGTEAEEILKAASLNALSRVFYDQNQGLNLVIKQGSRFVPNPSADVAKEVLDHLIYEFNYGNRESRTGKEIERKFGGLGYGWERDVLRLILATLFRAGAIDVSHKGQRFDSYHDPHSWEPFTNNVAFRSALFTPVKPIDLQTLKKAVETFEKLTGQTVDMDKNAIARELKKFAGEKAEQFVELNAQANAHRLPVAERLSAYREMLGSIRSGSAEDCVNILAGEGKSLIDESNFVQRLGQALTPENLEILHQARVTVNQLGPTLLNRRSKKSLRICKTTFIQ